MEYCRSDLNKVIKHFKQLKKDQQPLPLPNQRGMPIYNNQFQTQTLEKDKQEKIMLFANGFSLSPVLPLEIIGRFFVHLTLGLEALHKRNFLHRDLKSENILLTTNPIQTGWKDCVLKIADLGFSRELERNALAETYCGLIHYYFSI